MRIIYIKSLASLPMSRVLAHPLSLMSHMFDRESILRSSCTKLYERLNLRTRAEETFYLKSPRDGDFL
jgi:hypothetical protein